MVQPDGAILIGAEDGLVGWREGKVQRMTIKNALPCDFVISFIQDKRETLVALHSLRRGGILGF